MLFLPLVLAVMAVFMSVFEVDRYQLQLELSPYPTEALLLTLSGSGNIINAERCFPVRLRVSEDRETDGTHDKNISM